MVVLRLIFDIIISITSLTIINVKNLYDHMPYLYMFQPQQWLLWLCVTICFEIYMITCHCNVCNLVYLLFVFNLYDDACYICCIFIIICVVTYIWVWIFIHVYCTFFSCSGTSEALLPATNHPKAVGRVCHATNCQLHSQQVVALLIRQCVNLFSNWLVVTWGCVGWHTWSRLSCVSISSASSEQA